MTTITIITHLFNAFLFIVAATGLYVFYEGIWTKRNKKRKPYQSPEEKIMKSVEPDDYFNTEEGYKTWRKYIVDKRNEYVN